MKNYDSNICRPLNRPVPEVEQIEPLENPTADTQFENEFYKLFESLSLENFAYVY